MAVELKIKIKGYADHLNRAMSKSKAGLSNFAKGVGKALGGVGIAFGVVAGVFYKIKSAIDPIADRLDVIGKSAKRIGITTDEFQQLAFAARRTGVDTATVEKSFKRMQKTIGDAGKGLSTAKDAIRALGLSFEDLDGKTPIEQFEILAKRLGLVENQTIKNAVAQDLFGRAGLAIAPLIDQYDGLKNELRDINGLIGEDGVKAAEDYKDALENLKTSFDGFIAKSKAIESLTKFFERFEAVLSKMEDVGGRQELAEGGAEQAFGASALLGLVSPATFLTSGIIGGVKSTADKTQADREIRNLRDKIKTRGSQDELAGEVNKAIKDYTSGAGSKAAKVLKTGLTSGGGGTFESLGGDISGGGFDARQTVAQEQLSVLKEIKDLTRESVNKSTTMTDEGRTAYMRSQTGEAIKD